MFFQHEQKSSLFEQGENVLMIAVYDKIKLDFRKRSESPAHKRKLSRTAVTTVAQYINS